MLRRADLACKVRGRILDPEQAAKVKGIAPKSPFQIGGAGAVGTGTLRGIPELERLHEAGFRVWPFEEPALRAKRADRKSTRLNSSHLGISYAVFCFKK